MDYGDSLLIRLRSSRPRRFIFFMTEALRGVKGLWVLLFLESFYWSLKRRAGLWPLATRLRRGAFIANHLAWSQNGPCRCIIIVPPQAPGGPVALGYGARAPGPQWPSRFAPAPSPRPRRSPRLALFSCFLRTNHVYLSLARCPARRGVLPGKQGVAGENVHICPHFGGHLGVFCLISIGYAKNAGKIGQNWGCCEQKKPFGERNGAGLRQTRRDWEFRGHGVIA